jgi:predicted deacylase
LTTLENQNVDGRSDVSTGTRIWTPLQLERDGKHADCLRIPISSDRSAYGWLPVPLISVRNGGGKVALLVAGVHGDEYEGPLALMNLARSLEPQDITGQVIIIPSLNFPAVRAGRRSSPLDGGNLNRAFPGHALGTPTEMIAHYLVEVLLPRVDLVVDLHAGGSSLDYVHCAMIRPGRSADEQRSLLELLRIFGAPVSFVTAGQGGGGATTLQAACTQAGVPNVTAELGGGGTLSQPGLELAGAGVKRLLKHVGIAPMLDVPSPPATRFMEVPGVDYFLYAARPGFFEPLASVGDDVRCGQIAGRLYSYEEPLCPPIEVRFERDGQVACRRFPTLADRGDCLFSLMRPLDGPSDLVM